MPVEASLRITSRGSALVHEMWDPQPADGSARLSGPTTVFYTEGDRLMLMHYCDLGNRPQMAAMPSNGKTLEFDMTGISGPLQDGYMHHALFTRSDANRHVEEWTALLGGKQMTFRLELQRKSEASPAR